MRFPQRASPRRRSKRDVREPIGRSRRCCGVAMDSYAKTTRSGRNTRAMRHVSRVATDNFPRKSTWPAETKPMMAKQVDCAPRWQCRLGYFSGGVGRPYRKKTNERENSERSADSAELPLSFGRWPFPHSVDTQPNDKQKSGRHCRMGGADCVFASPHSTT